MAERSTAEPLSTAQALTMYRSELVAGGISEETADDMVRDAGGRIIQADGLRVRLDL